MKQKEMITLIGDLVFAYVNKDPENPHDFETEAITKACEVYLKGSNDNKYTEHFMNNIKKEMLSKDIV